MPYNLPRTPFTVPLACLALACLALTSGCTSTPASPQTAPSTNTTTPDLRTYLHDQLGDSRPTPHPDRDAIRARIDLATPAHLATVADEDLAAAWNATSSPKLETELLRRALLTRDDLFRARLRQVRVGDTPILVKAAWGAPWEIRHPPQGTTLWSYGPSGSRVAIFDNGTVTAIEY
jgi:hypothetical protein